MHRIRTQADKYEYYTLCRRLDPPTSRETIAEVLGLSLSSLYVLVSREKKIRADQIEILKIQVEQVSDMVGSINLVTFKDYLRKYPRFGQNAYLLERLTTKRKPLQSNCIKILESLRDMLNQAEV